MSVLTQKVLVLNRRWQGYEETTVEEAFGDLFRGACTAIDTEHMVAVRWADWCLLPVRDGDASIGTTHGRIRVPTVICKSQYDDMPKRRPAWSRREIRNRDGCICQYTGKYAPDGNVDHVIPIKNGGKNTWENTVWSIVGVNSMKGARTPEEAGLRLIRKPFQPPALPANMYITPKHSDWELFLPRTRTQNR